MKKNQFISQLRFCGIALMGVGALMISSCADDGYDDDERWSSNIKNTTLESPSTDDITVTSSADGKSQTIAWPVVGGAGGYLVSFYAAGAADSIVADSIIDGTQLTVQREEDMNYVFSIKTLGNAANNNKGAETATEYAFTTFMPGSAPVVPSGTDLYEWAQTEEIKTLIETPTEETLIFDLEAGGEYTLSDIVDFGHNKVILRTASKTEWATIKYDNGASIRFGGGFILRYMNIDGEATTDPIIGLSDNPNEAIKGAGDHYVINDPVTVQNCYIYNVQRQFLHDNKKKYCIALFTIDNTQVKFTTDAGMSSNSYFLVYDGGGFINNFTATNSTFWNTVNKDGEMHEARYFIRYNNSGRCDRAGFSYNMISFKNCTFYNIVKSGQMANHGGFDGRATSYYDIQNNIFVDCGNNQVARRLIGRSNAQAEITFNNNTYWFDGAAESGNTSYDNGYQLTTDPAFVDAANAIFTPTGAEQVSMKTGDPRWFAEE